jgi:hypothetical protein
MHAARVLGDVAADGAGDLARRIGRVVQAEGRGDIGDRCVAHPRLHDCDARARIEPHDPHELRHGEQHAVAQRQRAARKAGAGAARHHRNAACRASLEDALDLLLGLGERHDHRHPPIGGKPVAFIGPGVFLFPQHGALRHELAQPAHHLALPRDVDPL